MVEAGLSPQHVLRTATRDAAKVFSLDPEAGTLETGKLADLVILSADPLIDIHNLSKIVEVIKAGQVVKSSNESQEINQPRAPRIGSITWAPRTLSYS
jgi:imidazolonepropionase-like amidohydrolase